MRMGLGEYVIIALLFICGIFVLDQVWSWFSPIHTYENGRVISKVYMPKSSSTGIGVTSVNGETGTTVITTSTPEAYTMIVNTPSGTCSAKCSPNTYGIVVEGDVVKVRTKTTHIFRFATKLVEGKV